MQNNKSGQNYRVTLRVKETSFESFPPLLQTSLFLEALMRFPFLHRLKYWFSPNWFCLKVQLAGNILEQVCWSWWSHCYLDFGNTPSQPSSVDIKSYRGPPSPYRRGTQSHPITETRTRPNMLRIHRRFDSKLFCFGWSSVNFVRKLNPGKPWSKNFFNSTISRGRYHA